MRPQINDQPELDFQASNLRISNEYFAKYKAISKILDAQPEILKAIHHDLERAKPKGHRSRQRFQYSSDTVLRILICQGLEELSLRGVVVRIDDSHFLRRFVRIDSGPMMDFSTLCTLKNAIQPQTWKKLNQDLARAAVEAGQIHGEALRLDTTAVETNIHWPTDSSLLWDAYRLLERRMRQAREIDPRSVGKRRAQCKAVKRTHQKIARQARQSAPELKPLYSTLIGFVEGICEWGMETATALIAGIESRGYSAREHVAAEALVEQIVQDRELAERVIDQARRRVLQGESVPNDEKLFSLFEPHTELLKRGKAGKDMEFGHMIQIQQVSEKFITDYAVFEKKPAEPALLDAALEHHKALFGQLPDQFTADKGYFESETVAALRKKIAVVSIAKKGKRTPEETEQEHDPLFRLAQRFRAGVEGTISFLKRVLGLARCFNKGWENFQSTVGATVFAHNLLILARC